MKSEIMFHAYNINRNKIEFKTLPQPKEYQPHVLVAENKNLSAKVERKVIGESK